MTIIDFNTGKGLYAFQLRDVETEPHSHPALEILIADTGRFAISTSDTVHERLAFAVIDRNVKHKLIATDCTLTVLMIEHNVSIAKAILSERQINLTDGFYGRRDANNDQAIGAVLTQEIRSLDSFNDYEARIAMVIHYIDNHELEYESMNKVLQQVVNLSESRLSHLFNENVGISPKKYLVWSKLKKTINQHLDKKEDLFTALIRGGFYDQPHFSKAFKTMLGVKPSTAYNSRTVQVLPGFPS